MAADRHGDGPDVRRDRRRDDILVRDVRSVPGLDRHFRLTGRARPENERLLAALGL